VHTIAEQAAVIRGRSSMSGEIGLARDGHELEVIKRIRKVT
jgi:hypothetical protein